jgi:hypothetical protein
MVFCAKKIYPALFIEQGSISNLTTFPNLTQSNTVKIRKQKLCNFLCQCTVEPKFMRGGNNLHALRTESGAQTCEVFYMIQRVAIQTDHNS